MKKHFKEIGKFFIILLVFFGVTSPFVVLFGPFDNIKRTVVGAILKSRHPQYITWLFSQDEIDISWEASVRLPNKSCLNSKQEPIRR